VGTSAGAAVVEFEITRKLSDLLDSSLVGSSNVGRDDKPAVAVGQGPANATSALVLFRLHGRPLGWGAGRVTDGRLDGAALVRQFLHQHVWTCALPLAERAVQGGRPLRMLDAATLLQLPPQPVASGPLVTVAVRSRTIASRLRPCLDSLLRLDYPALDLVLIDASDDRKQVEGLVREHYPQVRYSSAAGVGMASRRAIAECRGDILAVTDGDAVVDRHWVSAFVHVFLSDPEVMTVSGLGLPRYLRRPFRPTLPAGAPFCRHWWRVRDEHESIDGASERALERACCNVAYWRPGGALPSRYTRVWEPAALVRTSAVSLTSHPSTRRGLVRTLDRHVDLRDGVVPISDASTYDALRLRVTWLGEPVGTVRIAHHGAVVSRLWIEDAIAQQLTASVLDAGLRLGPQISQALLTADLVRYIVSRWEPVMQGTSAPATVRTAAA
jgi:glycosyltransferase involved in cell wall biosynthesis